MATFFIASAKKKKKYEIGSCLCALRAAADVAPIFPAIGFKCSVADRRPRKEGPRNAPPWGNAPPKNRGPLRRRPPKSFPLKIKLSDSCACVHMYVPEKI